MKKVLYITLFALFTLIMVGCGKESKKTDYSFELVLDDLSELRESVVLNVTLKDENDELKNSEIKSQIAKKDSDKVISTKTVKLDSNTKSAEISFTKLTAETTYVVTFYTGVDGERIDLIVEEVTTSNLGTEDNPYVLRTKDDFTKYLKNDRSAHFVLEADVDFGGKGVNPLFTSSSAFTGSFDGKGFAIKNYVVSDFEANGDPKHITTSTQYYGIFGYIGSNGVVENVTFDSAKVYIARKSTMSSSQTFYYGLLAGYNAGTIENVNVTNSKVFVKTTNKTKDLLTVGGLVGMNTAQGTITNVNVGLELTVDGVIDGNVGGIVGTTLNADTVTKEVEGKKTTVANISNATFDGSINVNIVGSNGYDANTVVGGILGRNYRSLVENCESKGTINVKVSYTSVASAKIIVGGLLGWNINDNGKLVNSKSSIAFDITSFNIPGEESDKLEVVGGLLVGRNGGSAPATAVVKGCEYTLADGAVNKIHVLSSSRVEVSAALIGAVVSTSGVDTNTSASTLDIVVQNYVFDEENKVEVADGDPILVHIAASTK